MSFAIWYKPGRPLRRPLAAGMVFATYTAYYERQGDELNGLGNKAPYAGFYAFVHQRNPLPPPQLRRHGYRLAGLTGSPYQGFRIAWDYAAFFPQRRAA